MVGGQLRDRSGGWPPRDPPADPPRAHHHAGVAARPRPLALRRPRRAVERPPAHRRLKILRVPVAERNPVTEPTPVTELVEVPPWALRQAQGAERLHGSG
ncbi:hypothetical protein PLANTIT3_20090 [Plantibacter sp. T3]|nr:hypothetical protein PLANTIT3_20090 [Plantibacter sp. T3]